MLSAMMNAEVGDDVFAQDPTVNRLQDYAAELFGMEAALYCPSGTMTNQIALKVLTNAPGEVIMEQNSHTYKYEGGGLAFTSGCAAKLLPGDRGRLSAKQIALAINPEDDHLPISQAVSLENTCNKSGGSYYDFKEIKKISSLCTEKEINLHLDGARLFNAIVETPETPEDYGKVFDTISICLSKGLGAPVGSLLLGNRELIMYARRIRKMLGGGMRQAGYLAAAGIYALTNHVDRLREDHGLAKEIGKILTQCDYVSKLLQVDTNILVFELNSQISVGNYLEYLEQNDVLAVPFGGQMVRFVTHLDVDDRILPRLKEILPAYPSV